MLYSSVVYLLHVWMSDAGELHQEAVTMATMDIAEDVFVKANDLLQDVDANIVKTATLRKQMPVKCAQLLARRCRLQLLSIVSVSHHCVTLSNWSPIKLQSSCCDIDCNVQ